MSRKRTADLDSPRYAYPRDYPTTAVECLDDIAATESWFDRKAEFGQALWEVLGYGISRVCGDPLQPGQSSEIDPELGPALRRLERHLQAARDLLSHPTNPQDGLVVLADLLDVLAVVESARVMVRRMILWANKQQPVATH